MSMPESREPSKRPLALREAHTNREYPFSPRIINPVKVKRIIIFSADQTIRESAATLQQEMPWTRIEILTNPRHVAECPAEGACVFLFDDTGLNLTDTKRIRRVRPDSLIVLLSSNIFVQCSPPNVARVKYPYTAKADLVFAVDRTGFAPEKVIVNAVRAAEDCLNIARYSKARRFIFLIVDDEPRWFSQFLPVLYEIIGQRADVSIARTFEQSMQFIFGVEKEAEIDPDHFVTHGHGDDVVCLITDIFFPKGEVLDCKAGLELIPLVRQYYPRIPIIIASKAREAAELQTDAFILPKGDPGSLERLREYILNYSGLGDFLVLDSSSTEIYRLKTIKDLYRLLCGMIPGDPAAELLLERLESYARRDQFSTWLYMHSFHELAETVQPRRGKGWRLVTELKRYLWREIQRIRCSPLSIGHAKVYDLQQLLRVFRDITEDEIQPLADRDIVSSWLDRLSYPELAEELRPIHGTWSGQKETIVSTVEKWIRLYADRAEQPLPLPWNVTGSRET
jgi:hypothetical protein